MLTVTTVDGRVDHFSLHEYQAARLIFKKMPRVHDVECYCCKPKLKKNQISLNNKALDPNGQTSKETIHTELGSSRLESLFFFLDPKLGLSIDTRVLITDIYTSFHFLFLQVT